jgi:hypothetical protein
MINNCELLIIVNYLVDETLRNLTEEFPAEVFFYLCLYVYVCVYMYMYMYTHTH